MELRGNLLVIIFLKKCFSVSGSMLFYLEYWTENMQGILGDDEVFRQRCLRISFPVFPIPGFWIQFRLLRRAGMGVERVSASFDFWLSSS